MTEQQSGPRVVRTRAELAMVRSNLTGVVAVVMTMGALHEGHAALLREARSRADHVVATVFLNPLQFGSASDLAAYPQTLDADLAVCAREGVDLVFAPARDEVYPDGDPLVRVSAGPLGEVLEGASRPGHFDGVLTVVAKLLHLVRPHVAVFGRKDAQQLTLIRLAVRDLDLGVDVVGVPTVRDPDGLALSSRNVRLSPVQRGQALALHRGLRAGKVAAGQGTEAVLAAARAELDAEPGCDVDYLVLTDDVTLEQVAPDYRGPALLAVAALVGGTRLIDNVPLTVGLED